MHLFLTGERGIGKSTVIYKYLLLSQVAYQGIRTFLVDEDDVRSVMGESFNKKKSSHPQSFLLAKRNAGGRFAIDTQAFDVNMVGILTGLTPDGGLIILDELGFLEEEATVFKRTVINLLDGSLPILGVLKKHSSPFLDEIAGHPRVSVMEVCEENLKDLPIAVAEHFKRFF